jgi:hypothetical protein
MLAIWLAAASFVVAHGGSARLLLDPLRVNPGGTVVVEGDDLSADDQITLVLVGEERRLEVGAHVSDGQGHLVQAFVVPSDLAAGGYQLEAVGSAGDVISAPLVVSGLPVPPDGGQGGQGGQGGGLLVPLPSDWQSSLSSPAAGVAPPPVEAPASELHAGVTAAIVGGLIAVAVVLLTLLSKRRRIA